MCFYSGYFEKALAGDQWMESRTGMIKLDTESVDTFLKFQYWAYARRFCDYGLDDTRIVEWHTLVELWLFGDRRNVPLLQNETVDLMNRKIVELWEVPSAQINTIYTHTMAGSKLRVYVIDIIGKTAGSKNYKDDTLRTKNQDALVDLLKGVWKADKPYWTKQDVGALDMCQYHVHEAGVQCNKGGK